MSDRAAMQQAQLDVITVTLMREGINKHRARELADHFVNFTLTLPLPVQEPVGYVKGTYAGRLIYDTINPAVCLPVGMALYTAPLPVQESLTEEEIEAIGNQVANEKLVGRVPDFRVRFARAIEAKLKEKNYG